MFLWNSKDTGQDADINYTTASVHHSQGSQTWKIKQWNCNVWNLRPCGKNEVRATRGTQNIICKLMINKHKRICIGVPRNDFAIPGYNWSRISNNIYCMPEGENEIWGKKKSDLQLLTFSCKSLWPPCLVPRQPPAIHTRPFTFLFEEVTRPYTRNFHTWTSHGFHAILMSSSLCSMKQIISAFTSQQHLNAAMPTSLSMPCALHFAHIIKTQGKLLVPKTEKTAV